MVLKCDMIEISHLQVLGGNCVDTGYWCAISDEPKLVPKCPEKDC
jgi:hypothetical protein